MREALNFEITLYTCGMILHLLACHLGNHYEDKHMDHGKWLLSQLTTTAKRGNQASTFEHKLANGYHVLNMIILNSLMRVALMIIV